MHEKSLKYCLIIIFNCLTSFPLFSQFFTPVPLGSSPNPVGSGARAMGQGNAFIAIADDATSASWNPGGLSQLERPEFSFAYEYFSRDERINSDDQPQAKTRSVLNLNDLNYASFVVPYFYNRNMVFSLNYLKPSASYA